CQRTRRVDAECPRGRRARPMDRGRPRVPPVTSLRRRAWERDAPMARNRLIAGYRSTARRSGMAVQGGADRAAGLAMGQLMPGASARTEPAGASPIDNSAAGAGDCDLRWNVPVRVQEGGPAAFLRSRRWAFLRAGAGDCDLRLSGMLRGE